MALFALSFFVSLKQSFMLHWFLVLAVTILGVWRVLFDGGGYRLAIVLHQYMWQESINLWDREIGTNIRCNVNNSWIIMSFIFLFNKNYSHKLWLRLPIIIAIYCYLYARCYSIHEIFSILLTSYFSIRSIWFVDGSWLSTELFVLNWALNCLFLLPYFC